MKTKLVHLLVVVALVISLVSAIAVVPGTSMAAVNVPPVAQAGQDQAVQGLDLSKHAGPYPQVTLDGSASFDLNRGDTLKYQWTQTSGPSSTNIVSPTSAITLVDLPDVAGTYWFKLKVTDTYTPQYSDTDEVMVIAGSTWFVRQCGVDATNRDGTAFTFAGTNGQGGFIGPWRSITYAINRPEVLDGDRIMVGPTPDPCGGATFYGGDSHPEKIVVNKWLTIWSTEGRDKTVIDVSTQSINTVEQVVEIAHDRVTFGGDTHGFTLKGAPVGIWAHDTVKAAGGLIQMVVVIDSSGSISPSDYTVMKTGLANAVKDPDIVPQNKTLELGVVQFSDAAQTEVAMTLIDSQTTANNVAADIMGMVQIAGVTALGDGIKLAKDMMVASSNFANAGRSVINVSTDGGSNYGSDPVTERNAAIAAGIDELSAEMVNVDQATYEWMRDSIVYPQPAQEAPPYPDPAGSKGFVVKVTNYSEYETAIKAKFGATLEPVPSKYIYIQQNKIIVDGAHCNQVGAEYVGIKVEGCTMPVIDDNIVDVYGVDSGVGIALSECPVGMFKIASDDYLWSGARVTNNGVTVDADSMALGIVLIKCPEALVELNTVEVTVGPSCCASPIAWGIMVAECDKVQVINNPLVKVTVGNDAVGAGFGIEVVDSQKAKVAGNTVNVDVSVTSAKIGGLLGIGIHMGRCPISNVDSNLVVVHGTGEVTTVETVGTSEGIAALDAGELQALDQVMAEIVGQDAVVGLCGGLVLGIVVSDCDLINVTNNPDVEAIVTICVTASDGCVLGAGGGFAFGIAVLGSIAPDVINNGVVADATTTVTVTASSEGDPTAGVGGGVAGGFGIVVANCVPDFIHGLAAMVSYNEVEAYGQVTAEIWAVNTVAGTDYTESVLGKLDSEVLSAIYEIVTKSAENEQVDVQISGQPQQIATFAAGGARGIGVGITALMSDGASITANNPVAGQGTVDVTVVGLTDVSADFTGSLGGGLGLGIGILDIGCNPTVIADNGVSALPPPDAGETALQLSGVIGYGEATADIAAAVITSDEDCAAAIGGGAGVGLGILVTGLFTRNDAEQATAPEAQPEFDAVITGNVVNADGKSSVLVEAYDMMTDGSARALGESLGVGGGIAVTAIGCVLIDGNTVDALGDADANVYAAGISAEDPEALGVSSGVGFGIAAGVVGYAEIVGNTADAVGTAIGTFMAVEEAILVDIEDANAFGTTIGAGLGIALANHGYTYVSQNHASGVGNADVTVIACDLEPLEWAWATALAFANGEGLALLEIKGGADVKESNTFEAGANVDIAYLEACANYEHAAGLGWAEAIDVLFVFCKAGIDFNYNDMPGLILSSASGDDPSLVGYQDLGMLAVGEKGSVDARYNYWGDATGPSVFGPGNGQGIAWETCHAGVSYEPWLYVEHQICLDDHIGRFGFAIPLHSCWNTFSTPIALEARVDTFGELLDFSGIEGKVTIAWWFDAETQSWVQVLDGDLIEPLDGMYIKMNADANVLLLTCDAPSGAAPGLPQTRPLEGGWNLIGPNPPFCWSDQCVDEAVSSIVDSEACAFVLSPDIGGQESWVWTPGSGCSEDMEIGQAYWVWMNASDTLAGFGVAPVRNLYPCEFCD